MTVMENVELDDQSVTRSTLRGAERAARRRLRPPRPPPNVHLDARETPRSTFFIWWMDFVQVDACEAPRRTLCGRAARPAPPSPSPAAFDVRRRGRAARTSAAHGRRTGGARAS